MVMSKILLGVVVGFLEDMIIAKCLLMLLTSRLKIKTFESVILLLQAYPCFTK